MNSRPAQNGFVLVAVLVVILLASMIAVSLLFRVRAEEAASACSASSEQAWAAAMTGVAEVIRFMREATPGSLDWRNSPDTFREQWVYDDGADRWYFTVYSAGDPGELEDLRYGLTDEAGKLHLNHATEEALGKLPDMPPLLVQALMDYLDPDDDPRPEGAEQEYYDALPSPYTLRNGALASMEELLLVRGFSPAVVYGEDLNLNFRLDPNENDSDQSFPPDDNDGLLDRGLSPYVTVMSYDLNETSEGLPRTNLNDPQDPLMTDALPEATVAYIEALRRNQATLEHPWDLLEANGEFKDDHGRDVKMESGVDKATLGMVLDQLTTTIEDRTDGLINVNTAPLAVLQTIPGIDMTLAESILSARRYLSPERRNTIAWLYQDDVVSAEVFKQIAPHLTARSYQYRFHVIGFGVPSGRYRVFDVVLDFGPAEPAIAYLREITRLGIPFKIEVNTLIQDAESTSAAARTPVRPHRAASACRPSAPPPAPKDVSHA
ncbi:MAG: general secretion pathway protein GspK [Verrucomicrobia bacterium]|nr:general secretion pathway protein GspK [Verrucomicrobiota bacterium]